MLVSRLHHKLILLENSLANEASQNAHVPKCTLRFCTPFASHFSQQNEFLKKSGIPLSAAEFSELMADIGGFDGKRNVCVAVSGGADSMALLLLASLWAKSQNAKIVALTVNHNLREEAAGEAKQVKAWCENLGVEHHTLNWQYRAKPTAAIQETARAARYKLLTDFCLQHNISNLLTAHHAGDQAETLFFRLARGSGMIGLSAMLPVTTINSVRLLRPLLTIRKERLIASLQSSGQAWIEDPSNHDLRYSRVRIRKQLEAIENQEIFYERVTAICQSFAKARKHIESLLVNYMDNNIKFHSDGSALANFTLENKSSLLPYLAVERTIKLLANHSKPLRSEKINNLIAWLYDDHSKQKKRTLAGLIFNKRQSGEVVIMPEIL